MLWRAVLESAEGEKNVLFSGVGEKYTLSCWLARANFVKRRRLRPDEKGIETRSSVGAQEGNR